MLRSIGNSLGNPCSCRSSSNSSSSSSISVYFVLLLITMWKTDSWPWLSMFIQKATIVKRKMPPNVDGLNTSSGNGTVTVRKLINAAAGFSIQLHHLSIFYQFIPVEIETISVEHILAQDTTTTHNVIHKRAQWSAKAEFHDNITALQAQAQPSQLYPQSFIIRCKLIGIGWHYHFFKRQATLSIGSSQHPSYTE